MEVSTFVDKHVNYINKHQEQLAILNAYSEEDLQTKPVNGGWSIAECTKHMILASRPYIDRIEKRLAAAQPENTPHFKRGRLGKYFTFGMLPKEDGSIKNKMKTMSWFDPAKSKNYPEYNGLNGHELIVELQLVYSRIDDALHNSKKLNLNKHKIVSTLGPIIQFKLGDAFAFTLAHNARHLHQINRIEKEIGITV